MEDDAGPWDAELARLAGALREGQHMLACMRLAQFALELEHRIRREERALATVSYAPLALAKVRGEHAALRRLVAMIASALDRGDDRRALDGVSKLRSVLVLHVAKEERLPLLGGHVHA